MKQCLSPLVEVHFHLQIVSHSFRESVQAVAARCPKTYKPAITALNRMIDTAPWPILWSCQNQGPCITFLSCHVLEKPPDSLNDTIPPRKMALKTHTWITLWFLITTPIVLWDAGYLFMRFVLLRYLKWPYLRALFCRPRSMKVVIFGVLFSSAHMFYRAATCTGYGNRMACTKRWDDFSVLSLLFKAFIY